MEDPVQKSPSKDSFLQEPQKKDPSWRSLYRGCFVQEPQKRFIDMERQLRNL